MATDRSCGGIGPTDTTVGKASTMGSAQANRFRALDGLGDGGMMRASLALLRLASTAIPPPPRITIDSGGGINVWPKSVSAPGRNI